MRGRPGVRSIVVNTTYLTGTRGAASLLRGLYAIALARYLGPEVYGLYGYGHAWYLSFLPLTLLGMDAILGQEIGRDRFQGAQLVSRTFVLRALVALGTAAVCGVVGWLLEDGESLRLLMLVFALTLLGRSLAMWTQSVYVAY